MILKKMFPCLAALFLLTACLAGLQRGVSADGMFVSSALPRLAVQPASEFRMISHGMTGALVSEMGSLVRGINAQVWYELNAAPAAKGVPASQLVIYLAELSNAWSWSLNPLYTDAQGLPMLREGDLPMDGVDMSSRTYVRPQRLDPWMPAFLAAQTGWEGGILLRQYTWWTNQNATKMVAEYREAVPEGVDLFYDRAALAAFLERADQSFRLLRPEALPAISVMPSDPARPSGSLLAGVLGEADPSVVKLSLGM